MRISDILEISGSTGLYEKGNGSMWDDEHISKHLLELHLSQDTDAASRKRSTIISTIGWIESDLNGRKLNILDLGCGPGLYCEFLAGSGHTVTGVDFSKRSIDYAQKEAELKNLKISYLHQNYLELDAEDRFDLIIMIFCDLDVLIPDDRTRLLEKVYHALKSGGIFIFDSLNGKAPGRMDIGMKSWESAEAGFWRSGPYLALSENIHYKPEQVILQQHIVCTDTDDPSVYRFWTHYYSPDSLSLILRKQGFLEITSFNNVLPDDGTGMNEMVMFYHARKGDTI
jgi:2-polyprenyl-3-methyl-5-hydroxy-6-metoxy-1,4-benzoquinol methylase